jgi:uncharacterized SAM-dependent methyltransferase
MNNLTNDIGRVVREHKNGNYSETLARFSYLGDGAVDFLRFIQSPDYSGFNVEMDLIREMFVGGNYGRPINVVDLGVGNGEKGRVICELIGRVRRYLGIDMSREMLEIAEHTHRCLEQVCREYVVGDFSNPEIVKNLFSGVGNDSDSLILFLGNTLTNEVDVSAYMGELRRVFEYGSGARFLVGVEVFDGISGSEVEREYNNEDNYRLTFRPLGMIGVEQEDGELRIFFNEDAGRIEEVFRFTRERLVHIGGEEICFCEGDQVLLSITGKPLYRDIVSRFGGAGWRILNEKRRGNQCIFLLE